MGGRAFGPRPLLVSLAALFRLSHHRVWRGLHLLHCCALRGISGGATMTIEALAGLVPPSSLEQGPSYVRYWMCVGGHRTGTLNPSFCWGIYLPRILIGEASSMVPHRFGFLCPVAHPKHLVDGAQVLLDRRLRQVQAPGYLGVAQALHN